MIKIMHKIASISYPFRPIMLIVIALLFSFSFYIVFGRMIEIEKYLLLAMVSSAWFINLYLIAGYFHHQLNNNNNPLGLAQRLLIKLKAIFVWLLSIVFILLSSTLLYLTFKAIKLASI